LALWTVTALAILVGNRAKKVIHPVLLQKIAAGAFALVGVVLLLRAWGFSSRRRFDSVPGHICSPTDSIA